MLAVVISISLMSVWFGVEAYTACIPGSKFPWAFPELLALRLLSTTVVDKVLLYQTNQPALFEKSGMR